MKRSAPPTFVFSRARGAWLATHGGPPLFSSSFRIPLSAAFYATREASQRWRFCLMQDYLYSLPASRAHAAIFSAVRHTGPTLLGHRDSGVPSPERGRFAPRACAFWWVIEVLDRNSENDTLVFCIRGARFRSNALLFCRQTSQMSDSL